MKQVAAPLPLEFGAECCACRYTGQGFLTGLLTKLLNSTISHSWHCGFFEVAIAVSALSKELKS